MTLKEFISSVGGSVIADDVMGTEAALAATSEKALLLEVARAQQAGVVGEWKFYQKKGWRYVSGVDAVYYDTHLDTVIFFAVVIGANNGLLD